MSERRSLLWNGIVAVSIALGIGFNHRLTAEPSIYFIHLVLLGLLVAVVLASLAKAAARPFENRWRDLGVIVLALLYMGLGVGNSRFAASFMAIGLLFGTFYAFRVILGNWKVSTSLLCGAICAGVVIGTYRMVGSGRILEGFGPIGIATRLRVTELGGDNAYALLIANAVVAALYLAVVNPMLSARLAIAALIGYLVVHLVATLSRGGMVALAIGSLAFLVVRSPTQARRIAVAGVALLCTGLGVLWLLGSEAGAVLERYDILADPAGTERIAIWRMLVAHVFSSPVRAIFGWGTGALDLWTPWVTLQSAHSAFLDVLYMYGLVGVGALVLFLWWTGRGLLRLPPSEEKALLLAVFSQLVSASVYDSYYGAIQIGWLFGLWFGLMWTRIAQSHESGTMPAGIVHPRLEAAWEGSMAGRDTVELVDYLRVLWKRKAMIIWLVFVSAGMASLVSYMMRPVYEVSRVLRIGQIAHLSVQVGQADQIASLERSLIETREAVIETITDQRLLEEVRAKIVPEVPIERFTKRVMVDRKANPPTQVSAHVRYTVRGDTPAQAAAVADAIAESIIQRHAKVYQQGLAVKQGYEEELKGKIDVLSKEIQELRRAFDAMRTSRRVDAAALVLLQANLEDRERSLLGLKRELRDVQLSSLSPMLENTRVIAPEAMPTTPVKPKKIQNVLIGVAVSLLGGTFLAFFLEYWERISRERGKSTGPTIT